METDTTTMEPKADVFGNQLNDFDVWDDDKEDGGFVDFSDFDSNAFAQPSSKNDTSEDTHEHTESTSSLTEKSEGCKGSGSGRRHSGRNHHNRSNDSNDKHHSHSRQRSNSKKRSSSQKRRSTSRRHPALTEHLSSSQGELEMKALEDEISELSGGTSSISNTGGVDILSPNRKKLTNSPASEAGVFVTDQHSPRRSSSSGGRARVRRSRSAEGPTLYDVNEEETGAHGGFESEQILAQSPSRSSRPPPAGRRAPGRTKSMQSPIHRGPIRYTSLQPVDEDKADTTSGGLTVTRGLRRTASLKVTPKRENDKVVHSSMDGQETEEPIRGVRRTVSMGAHGRRQSRRNLMAHSDEASGGDDETPAPASRRGASRRANSSRALMADVVDADGKEIPDARPRHGRRAHSSRNLMANQDSMEHNSSDDGAIVSPEPGRPGLTRSNSIKRRTRGPRGGSNKTDENDKDGNVDAGSGRPALVRTNSMGRRARSSRALMGGRVAAGPPPSAPEEAVTGTERSGPHWGLARSGSIRIHQPKATQNVTSLFQTGL